MTDIRLRGCPRCGGQPIALIMRQCGENVVMIQCTKCGSTSGGVLFAGKVAACMGRRDLLPDLATARRQAAAAWNGGEGDGDDAEAAWPL